MTYLVSLINDHIFPAYLFIKEMEGKYDRLLLVASHRSSVQVSRIEKTLRLAEGKTPQIVVSETDLSDIKVALNNHRFLPEDRFIVHLSYDTTVMSIGIFEYFSKYDNASFYFIPPGENIIKEIRTSHERPLKYRVNVWEYFTLHGVRIKPNEKLTYSAKHTYELYEQYKMAGYNKDYLEIMKIFDQMDETNKIYYGGVWFEEYVYHRIKKEKGLADDCIYTGVKIFRSETDQENDNEIDIVFVLDNELYAGECKTSLSGVPGGKSGSKLLEDYLYKLAAVTIDFGMNVRQLFFTLHQLKKLNLDSIKRRMKILQLEVLIGRDDFKKEQLPLSFLK